MSTQSPKVLRSKLYALTGMDSAMAQRFIDLCDARWSQAWELTDGGVIVSGDVVVALGNYVAFVSGGTVTPTVTLPKPVEPEPVPVKAPITEVEPTVQSSSKRKRR